MSHIAIVGAGVVGCASAYALARLGHTVSVIDSRGSAAQVCSKANAGQLSYQFVEPFASPKTRASLPALLFDPQGPVRWQPTVRPGHWLWLVQFLGACRQKAHDASLHEQMRLSLHSQRVFGAWAAENPRLLTDTHYSTAGKLLIYGRNNSATQAESALRSKGTLDKTQFVVDAEGCKKREPALAHRNDADLSFGIWTPSEAVIDGAQWAANLLKESGASARFGQTATRLHPRADGQTALELDSGERLVADQVLVCAGLNTPHLLHQWHIGHRLRLEGLRGCSLTVPVTAPDRALHVSVTEVDHKIVYSRIGPQLRIAGFADLGQPEQAIPADRFRQLRGHLRALCGDTVDLAQAIEWHGFRPSTPKSPPVLGRIPGQAALWINAGHGALGLTLAAGCGDVLARRLSQPKAAQDRSVYATPGWLA